MNFSVRPGFNPGSLAANHLKPAYRQKTQGDFRKVTDNENAFFHLESRMLKRKNNILICKIGFK